MNNDPR